MSLVERIQPTQHTVVAPLLARGVTCSIGARTILSGVDLEVRIVGIGSLLEALQEQIVADGLCDIVTLMGPIGQDDLPEQYHWADVFVLPSFQEGLPVVLMEAMATELPVVTTRIAAISELVADPLMGRVVPPGRSDYIADAIEDLSRDADGRHAKGRAGRSAVLEEFTSENSAGKLIDLFNEIENL